MATALNDRGIGSSRGGKWHSSSVANVLSRAGLPDRVEALFIDDIGAAASPLVHS